MSMNTHDRHWHNVYDTLPEAERDAIEWAFNDAVSTLRVNGFLCRIDDRAAQLVAAITRFVIESKETP